MNRSEKEKTVPEREIGWLTICKRQLFVTKKSCASGELVNRNGAEAQRM
jgi:hypothetical protein